MRDRNSLGRFTLFRDGSPRVANLELKPKSTEFCSRVLSILASAKVELVLKIYLRCAEIARC
jgi:hypothetical protein